MLLITCSDSRVAVNVFASTDPGDLFVLRNVGNIIPPYEEDAAECHYAGAAIDFALKALQVKHIIICGHSECGAMIAIHQGLKKVQSENLKEWLKYGMENTLQAADHNSLSQQNVLFQIENLKSYPEVQKALNAGAVKLHGWWFELKKADVFAYSEQDESFILIDENSLPKILTMMS